MIWFLSSSEQIMTDSQLSSTLNNPEPSLHMNNSFSICLINISVNYLSRNNTKCPNKKDHFTFPMKLLICYVLCLFSMRFRTCDEIFMKLLTSSTWLEFAKRVDCSCMTVASSVFHFVIPAIIWLKNNRKLFRVKVDTISSTKW